MLYEINLISFFWYCNISKRIMIYGIAVSKMYENYYCKALSMISG